MKLKVEFVDGSIELVRVESIKLNMASKRLSFLYYCEEDYIVYNLKTVSRVTVDNEVIYDYLGRKENHRNENNNV